MENPQLLEELSLLSDSSNSFTHVRCFFSQYLPESYREQNPYSNALIVLRIDTFIGISMGYSWVIIGLLSG